MRSMLLLEPSPFSEKGQRVSLADPGTFTISKRKARMGRNHADREEPQKFLQQKGRSLQSFEVGCPATSGSPLTRRTGGKERRRRAHIGARPFSCIS